MHLAPTTLERDSLGMLGNKHACNDLYRVHAEKSCTSLTDATAPNGSM